MATSILSLVTSTPRALLSRAVLVAGSATVLLLAYAGPASADIPDGWSDPPPVHVVKFLLTFVGIPLLITLAIVALVYLPGVVRGESVAPAGARAEDQWLGGRRDTAELETADRDSGDTGGAGGTW
jgi:hypothetical protein